MKKKQRECSETSAYKIQTQGNYPEESIEHSEDGESLKSRRQLKLFRGKKTVDYSKNCAAHTKAIWRLLQSILTSKRLYVITLLYKANGSCLNLNKIQIKHRKFDQRLVIADWRIGWQLTVWPIDSGSLDKVLRIFVVEMRCDGNRNKNTYATTA